MIMKTYKQHNRAPKPSFRCMKRYAETLACSLAAVAAISLASCSDDDVSTSATPVKVPNTITFNLPDELQRLIYTDEVGAQHLPLLKGETVQLSYVVTPDGVDADDVEWGSTNEAVATVDDEGNVYAVSGTGDGYSTISVAPVGYSGSSGIEASLIVNVADELVPAQTLAIDAPKDELYGGDSLLLTPVITPDNATYKTVEWTSSDESIATVGIDGMLRAKVTEATAATVTITARTLDIDGSNLTAEKTITVRQVVQPQEVSLDQSVSADNGYAFPYNEQTTTLSYTTMPAECTTSYIQWTSSNPAVATVDNGVVTFTGRGQVTITATCPETGNSSSVKLDIPSGFVRETYHNPDHYIFASTGSAKHELHDGYLTMLTYAASATKQRADLRSTEAVYINSTSYPIFAVRMDDVLDTYASQGVTGRAINLDGSTYDGATRYAGNLGGGPGKWLHDYKCSDGTHVFIYDFSTQTWPTGGLLPAKEMKFDYIQFKYADIQPISSQVRYNVYWVQTFKTIDDVKEYIRGEGLTYEIVK